MIYAEMIKNIDEYNWDDGFEFPKSILNDEICDLALALKIFYLADGYGYLKDCRENQDCSALAWIKFEQTLYDDILQGRYKKTKYHYEIPLNKVQRYKLQKDGIDSIFLEDI